MVKSQLDRRERGLVATHTYHDTRLHRVEWTTSGPITGTDVKRRPARMGEVNEWMFS